MAHEKLTRAVPFELDRAADGACHQTGSPF